MKRENRTEAPVAAFPAHGVRHARQLAPEVSHVEIDIAVARGRMLHARTMQRAAWLVLAAPIVALARLAARMTVTAARRIRQARLRRETMDALYALDARMLRDIGIAYDQIPLIAAELAAGELATARAARTADAGLETADEAAAPRKAA